MWFVHRGYEGLFADWESINAKSSIFKNSLYNQNFKVYCNFFDLKVVKLQAAIKYAEDDIKGCVVSLKILEI